MVLLLMLMVVIFAFAASCCRSRSRNATARLLLCIQCRSQGVLYAVIHVAQIEKLVTVLGRLRLRMIHGTRTTVRWPPSLFRLWFGLRRRFLPISRKQVPKLDVMTFPVPPENFFSSAFATLVGHTHAHTHTGTLTPRGTYTRAHTHTHTHTVCCRRREKGKKKNCSFFFFPPESCASSAADGGNCGHFRGTCPNRRNNLPTAIRLEPS